MKNPQSILKRAWRYIAVTLFLFLLGIRAHSQDIPYNEVNYNLLNTLLFASVEVGYEFFIDYDQSVGAKVLINDRRNFRSESGGSKYSTNSLQVNYTYYFGEENPGSGIYVQPFVKYRFGNFKENERMLGAERQQAKTNMNSFIIGAGVGYEWNFSNSFVMGPHFNIGRGFGKESKDRFSALEWYGGFTVGYRF